MMKNPDLDELAKRIHQAQQKQSSNMSTPSYHSASDMAIGMRVMIEMVVCPAVGGGLGWAIDQWLAISPWATILFVILGAVAGVMQARKAAMRYENSLDSTRSMDADAKRMK